MTKVPLPATVAQQLEAIRASGEINMLDRPGVQVIADRRGFWELVVWLEDHAAEYARAILHGIEPVADEAVR